MAQFITSNRKISSRLLESVMETSKKNARGRRKSGTGRGISSTITKTQDARVGGATGHDSEITARTDTSRVAAKHGTSTSLHNRRNIANTKRPITTNNSKSKGNQTFPPSVKIETENFVSNFHNSIRAAKYKVHAPNCDCSKIVRIRNRYMDSLQHTPQQQTALCNDRVTSQYDNTIQFDIEGGISQQFDKRLQLSEETCLFDNLVVLPDTPRPSTAYTCKQTGFSRFQQNGIACEQKLAIEIFGAKKGDIGGNDDVSSFKVSCAICLLTGHYWNGFVALVSKSSDQLQPIIQTARRASKAKQQTGLHSDHAHFVCAVEISLLQSLKMAKTRSARLSSANQLLNQIQRSGEKLAEDAQAFNNGGGMTNGQEFKFVLGHHLTSVLQILTDQCNCKTNLLQYLLVIGYQNESFNLTLDLPGGKRHLGETTLEGAIREVEEESSLQLNKKWLESRISVRYGGIDKIETNLDLSSVEFHHGTTAESC
eukprot:scaffold29028_cov77-Cyclotella_meneghiniana.AAC.1